MKARCLTALPVYNEVQYVARVLEQVRQYSDEVLVVDDGSTDGTADCLATLAKEHEIHVVTHSQNRGYGAALQSAFEFAVERKYERLVTIDCDGQHQPRRIPRFFAAAKSADIVSGSRYLKHYEGDSAPPAQRRWINRQLTQELNRLLGFSLTDAFCGFKAYRVAILPHLRTTEPGYAMPLELWVLAARAGLKVMELPVPLIYLDESRSFGGSLDDANTRLNYYYEILDRSMKSAGLARPEPPRPAACGKGAG